MDSSTASNIYFHISVLDKEEEEDLGLGQFQSFKVVEEGHYDLDLDLLKVNNILKVLGHYASLDPKDYMADKVACIHNWAVQACNYLDTFT